MKSFLQRLEDASKTDHPVVMAFGRMNPPTTGHEKLVNRVQEIAKDYKAPHKIIVSHSMDSKKNPLDVDSKLKHAKRFFPGANITSSSKENPTFLHHAAELYKKGHDHLIMVAGSDRIAEYEQKLKQYNGTSGGSLFNFKKIEVKSSGERDPDSDDVSGMSASKMREHAKNNDFLSFKKGVPAHVPEKHAKELFHDVRRGMGINENYSRGLFKAVFVTGGPGSGKDIILREAIAENKSVELNITQAFDYLNDKIKLSEKSNDYRRESIRNRGPLIINGPADDCNRMMWIKEELEELGYDTFMVFVNTTNETSKERNEKLSKTLSESIRLEKWKLSQLHKERYHEEFENFVEFNNSSTLEEIEEDITDTYKKINRFIEGKNYKQVAFSWLKINGTNDYIKENENVKKNSRFFENYKAKRAGETSSRYPKISAGSGPTAAGPGDITPDNRAGDTNADSIKWDAPKRTKTYTFKTYSEASEATLQVNPEPKESNFSKDKEKTKNKKRGLTDLPTVNQRLRNVTSIGPEFDTRQQGTVYPMSGLGDVTYREEYSVKESHNDPGDNEMGVGGVLGGASNKEPMENPKDKMGQTITTIKKKKK
jgi:hypothetical protein